MSSTDPLCTVLSALESQGIQPKKTRNGYKCCCPAHDDKNPSMSIAKAHKGKVLLKCFAGCSVELICEALNIRVADLFPQESGVQSRRAQSANPGSSHDRSCSQVVHASESFASVDEAISSLVPKLGPSSATWFYHDRLGDCVGAVVRFDSSSGKEYRPISYDPVPSCWVIGAMPSPRPLYGLDELLKLDIGSTVYICEGEKAADAALSLGLNATTSVGGSQAPHLTDWSPLAQMRVVVMPDHDEAGEKYALAVTRQLQEVGAESVRIVALTSLEPDLPKSGDIADLVDKVEDRGAMREQLKALVRTTPEAETEPDQPAQPTTDAASHTNPATAELLVGLALKNYALGCSETGEPFAVNRERPCIASLLERSLKKELASKFRSIYGRVPPSTALADAFNVLEGMALDESVRPLSIRVAPIAGGIAVDLGCKDSKLVEISSSGWKLASQTPALFKRTPLVGELPEPVKGGTLDTLRAFLNVTDDTWPLALGWIVASFIPDIAHPIAIFGGQQGTGKTTAAKYLTACVDPSSAPLLSMPRSIEDWAVQLANTWTVVIDNISDIKPWLSDAMCKAVTGDGLVRRRLYTNSDVSVISFRRPIAITSIDPGALRGDLGERALLIDLDPIAPSHRRPESTLQRDFNRALPGILGALFDLLVGVLGKVDTVHLDEHPRMADFARVLKAIDEITGSESLELYLAQAERVAHSVVESDQVSEAIVQFMSTCAHWTGTAGEMLNLLKPDKLARGWPETPAAMAHRIRRLTPALGHVGVNVTPPVRNDRKRLYKIERLFSETAQTAHDPSRLA